MVNGCWQHISNGIPEIVIVAVVFVVVVAAVVAAVVVAVVVEVGLHVTCVHPGVVFKPPALPLLILPKRKVLFRRTV